MNKHASLRLKTLFNKLQIFVAPVSLIVLMPLFALAQEERVISKESWKNEPIQIIELKTKGKIIEFKKTFVENDEWLRGLTATVENVSDRPISRIVLALFFPRPLGTNTLEVPTYSVSMGYGRDPSSTDLANHKQVLPGERVDVKLLEVNLPSIKKDLETLGYSPKVTHVRLMVESVIFNDGTMWKGGDILYPDPANPRNKYNPELTLPGSVENPNQASQNCNSPAPIFQNASFLKFTLTFVSNNIYFPKPALTQLEETVPCNSRFLRAEYPSCGGSGCTRLSNVFSTLGNIIAL